MIKTQIIDIFNAPINAIAHQCNCYHCMGGGIARAIAIKFPDAEKADNATPLGEEKMGTYSSATIGNLTIYNCYTQGQYGQSECMTNYNSIRECFASLREDIEKNNPEGFTLGIPHGYGCGLGGGDWSIVENIIEESFKDAAFDVLICKLPS